MPLSIVLSVAALWTMEVRCLYAHAMVTTLPGNGKLYGPFHFSRDDSHYLFSDLKRPAELIDDMSLQLMSSPGNSEVFLPPEPSPLPGQPALQKPIRMLLHNYGNTQYVAQLEIGTSPPSGLTGEQQTFLVTKMLIRDFS